MTSGDAPAMLSLVKPSAGAFFDDESLLFTGRFLGYWGAYPLATNVSGLSCALDCKKLRRLALVPIPTASLIAGRRNAESLSEGTVEVALVIEPNLLGNIRDHSTFFNQQ